MGGKAESEKKWRNATLYDKKWRGKMKIKEKKLEEYQRYYYYKFTTSKTTRKPTKRKIRTTDKNKFFLKNNWT